MNLSHRRLPPTLGRTAPDLLRQLPTIQRESWGSRQDRQTTPDVKHRPHWQSGPQPLPARHAPATEHPRPRLQSLAGADHLRAPPSRLPGVRQPPGEILEPQHSPAVAPGVGRQGRRPQDTYHSHQWEPETPLAATASPVHRRKSLSPEPARTPPNKVGQIGSGHGVAWSRPVPRQSRRLRQTHTPKPPLPPCVHPGHSDHHIPTPGSNSPSRKQRWTAAHTPIAPNDRPWRPLQQGQPRTPGPTRLLQSHTSGPARHSTITVWPGHRGRSHRPNTTGPSMPHKTATQTLRAWNGAMGYLSPPTFTLLHSVRFPDWGGWRTTRWPTTIDQTLRHSLPRVISQARLNLSECHRDCALCTAVSRCTLPYIWFLLFFHLSLRLYCFVGLIIVVIKLSQRSRSSLQ